MTDRSSDGLKLAIVGGGGFRVPLIYRALLGADKGLGVTVVSLFDTEPERAEVIGRVLAEMAGRAGPGPGVLVPRVEVASDLGQALEGADFVFAAIRVGGLSGRVADERVALDLGLLGQETTGPGGVAFGLRTIPEMVRLAQAVQVHCPDAWVINFTNPAGMITEVLQHHLGDKAIGICDSPMGLAVRARRALGLDRQTGVGVEVDYVGLNHLGWLQGLRVDGIDRLGDLIADSRALETTEEGQLFGPEWIQTLGVIPNEYLYYYYFTRDAISAITSAPETRAELLARTQGEFYRTMAEIPSDALATWDRVRLQRNASYMAETRPCSQRHHDDVDHGGYETVAVALMTALAGGAETTLILNVANRGSQPGLAPDAVIEVTCTVDSDGPHPAPVTGLTGARLGLVQQVKAVEQLTISAALEASETKAQQALALHPLVDSVTVAGQLLARYRQRIPSLDSVFASSQQRSAPAT